jgi:glycosyltransferase involved in cell wall biosynthesis
VLALPSTNWTETFGMVQIEAMLCGTPVVASDLPGVREPVEVTGFGKLAGAGSVVDLAASLSEVLSCPERYTASAETVRALYGLDATIDAYERAYAGSTHAPRTLEPAS